MFGLFYLGTSIISHIGYKIKEASYNHNSKRNYNRKYGTYYTYTGAEKDINTDEQVFFYTEPNGDKVSKTYDYKLHDFRVVRNYSEEERQKKEEQMRNDPNNKERLIQLGWDYHRTDKTKLGLWYKDIYTGEIYAKRRIHYYHKLDGKYWEPFCSNGHTVLVNLKNPYIIASLGNEESDQKYKIFIDKFNLLDEEVRKEVLVKSATAF